MWLLRLDLLAFGHFTDVQLDLGPGLHLVYGPNEAGKTTTLRAIRQLLFGFDERTRDNFVHQNSNLRIGGIVRDRTGRELHVVRRKSRKDSLRGADEASSVDAELWQSILCGIDETTFSNRYGIDYEQLVNGGREIATGAGDLGEILFATGSGVADLTSIQKRLNEEAAELFKPQGKKQRLNQAITTWQEQQNLLTKKMLLVSEWEEVDRHRQESQKYLDQVVIEWTRKTEEADLYRRLQQSWPLVHEQKSLELQLSNFAIADRLPAEFSQMRQEAWLLLKHADSQEQTAAQDADDAINQLAGLEIPRELLGRTDELTRLISESGSYSKALKDCPQLVEQFESHSARCRELLLELGPPANDDPVIAMSVDRAQRMRINQLARKKSVLAQIIQQAEDRCKQIQQRIAEAQKKIANQPILRSSEPLRNAIRQARSEGDLESQLEKVNGEILALEGERRLQLERLGFDMTSIDKVKSMKTPTLEDLRKWDVEFDANLREQALQKSRLAELQREHRQSQDRLDEQRRESNLPTEAELVLSRTARTELLAEIRKSIASKKVPSKSLIDSFERSLEEADRIADRMRSEATMVAQLAKQTEDLTANESRQHELLSSLEELQVKLARLEERWQSEWTELGTKASSPREMQMWITRREAVLQSETQISRFATEADKLSERIRKQIMILSEFLNRSRPASIVQKSRSPSLESNLMTENQPAGQQLSFGWDLESSDDCARNGSRAQAVDAVSLAALLMSAEDRLSQEDFFQQTKKDAEETVARLTQEQQQVVEQLKNARDELALWQAEWRAALSELNITEDLSPDAAEACLETRSELFDQQRQAEQLQERIAAIQKDARQFEAKFKLFCQDLAPDLVSLEIADAVMLLRDRLLTGQKDLAKCNELTTRRHLAEQQLSQARDLRMQGKELVEQLCRTANVSLPEAETFSGSTEGLKITFDELTKVEAAAQRRVQLEDKLERVEKRLLELASGLPMAEYLIQIEQSSPELLANRIRDLDVECSRLAGERDRLNRQLGGVDEQLQRMDGSAEAAEIEEQQRQLLAQIRADVEQYSRIKLASSVLHSAVERYRDKIRGPVLSIASDLFRELTLESFDGLRVDEDSDNQPMLVGLRNGGREVISVDGMSEGTCDQLYLALRVASLMQEAAPRSHLPFIVDDILIQFDDARSAAALRVLARLGQQRQVIFFTHHEHLLDIARQNLAGGFAIQRLGG